jgi:orotidine-5'-phosphate decarboxylase
MAETAAERIIWSADVSSPAKLGWNIGRLPELRNVKLDRAFMEGRELRLLAEVAELGVNVFDDAKIVEIPSKVVEIAKKHLVYKPWMLNCMAGVVSNGVFAGDDPEKLDGLKRFADACLQAGTRPCAVTVLTSKTPEISEREFGFLPTDQVLDYLDLLLQAGFTDVVCSPKEVGAIRADSRFDKLDLNTPGIVMRGSSSPDQARTNTPGAAVKAGATRLVIGRALTGDDMLNNFRAIVRDIELANAA